MSPLKTLEFGLANFHNLTDFRLFLIIAELDLTSTEYLVQRTGYSRPLVSQSLTRLKQKGCVTDAYFADDARVRLVRMTETGQEIVDGLETQISTQPAR